VSRSKFSPNQDDAELAAKIGDAIKDFEAADTVKKEKAISRARADAFAFTAWELILC
jgi:hypothetical protein